MKDNGCNNQKYLQNDIYIYKVEKSYFVPLEVLKYKT